MSSRLLGIALLLWTSCASAQNVQQSGTITPEHTAYWVTSGVIADAGTSDDSPVTSLGATGPVCSNSARESSGAWNQFCIQANTSGPAIISLQNFGTAPAESIVFNINGAIQGFPTVSPLPVVAGDVATFSNSSGGLTDSGFTPTTFPLTVGVTSVINGTSNGLLYNNANKLGNLTTVPNGVLITSAGGTPSIATTLPSGLTLPNPIFSGTVAGSGTIPNSVLVNSATTVNGASCALGGSCTFTTPASNVTFTQSGIGAGQITFDQEQRGVIITPEQFGDGVPCSTASALGIQKAITAIGTIFGAGRVQLANCMYSVAGTLTIAFPTIEIAGYSSGTGSISSGITFTPTTVNQCAISSTAGAGILSNTSIRNLKITTADTTTYKKALCTSDNSVFTLENVYIANFFGGFATPITGAANSGTGEIRLTVANASVNYNNGYAVMVGGVAGTVEANSGWPIVVAGGSTIDLKGSKFTNVFASSTATATATTVGGTPLNVTLSSVSGTINNGALITGTGFPTNTLILSQVSGSAGGNGVYATSNPTTASAASATTNAVIISSSTGWQTLGRELYQVNNVAIVADLPLRISANPNTSGGIEAIDESNFNNLSLGSATGTNCAAMVDTGVVMSSVKFGGNQSWGGGQDGFCLRDNSSTAIGEQLSFDHVRQEQLAITGGHLFNIQPNNLLYSLSIRDPNMSSGTGILARNVANLQIDTPHWLSTSGVCLDIDSTVANTQINAGDWLAGSSTASLVGQFVTSGGNGKVGCLPPTVTYANTAPPVAQPTGSGTYAVSASSPIVLNATTGALTCPTCATSTPVASVFGRTGAVVSATNDYTIAQIGGLGTGIATALGTNVGTAGSPVVNGGALGTPSSGTLTNATGLPVAGITGLGTGIATALGIAVGSAGAPVILGGALGSPSSAGILPAHTLGGTVSGGGNQINNVIIGASTPLAGNFTILGATGAITGGTSITVGTNSVNGGTFANGPNTGTGAGSQFVAQLNGTANIGMGNISTLITGGTFDGTPVIYGASTIAVDIGGTTRAMNIGVGTTGIPGMTNVATTSAVCINTTTGLLTFDGTLGTCTVSDERLKSMGPRIDHALDKLLRINGVNYTWKDPKYGSGPQIGVGAQTVEKVFPELVQTGSDGIKSVDYQRLTAPIIEALRELKADNDNLKTEMKKLKNGLHQRPL